MKRHLKCFMLLTTCILTVWIAAYTLKSTVIASASTTLAVEPRVTVKAPGEQFNLTFVVTNVTELFVWEFNFTFNPSILEAVGYLEGPFLKDAGDTWPLEPSFNNTAGWAAAGGSLFPYPEHGASGSGILGYFTLRVKAEGMSNLHFVDTKLRSWDGELLTEIVHSSTEGLFQYPLLRDVAVTNLIASPTSVTVGDSVSVNVTVTNKGNVTETFDVDVFCNSTLIDVKTVTDLEVDGVDTVNFVWDTEGMQPGSYVLKAEAEAVSGETSTSDNVFSGMSVVVNAAPAGLPFEIIITVVAIVFVVALAGVLYFRMRKK